MIVTIREVDAEAIVQYARVPVAFAVHQVFDCLDDGASPAGVVLSERRLEDSYIKDYDAIPSEHPIQWPARFGDQRWTSFLAYADGGHVGGAVVVRPERSEHAILWDIRVSPGVRRVGVGSALFRSAEEWARKDGCRALEVETQNVNVPACRFYQRQGCFLHAVDRDAYDAFPDEVQLIWRKGL